MVYAIVIVLVVGSLVTAMASNSLRSTEYTGKRESARETAARTENAKPAKAEKPAKAPKAPKGENGQQDMPADPTAGKRQRTVFAAVTAVCVLAGAAGIVWALGSAKAELYSGGEAPAETAVEASLLSYTEAEPAAEEETPLVQVVNICEGTLKGKLLIVSDPSAVKLAISGDFGYDQEGKQVTALCEKYGAIAGINGGGYVDGNGRGNGGQPVGLIIYEGNIIYGTASRTYSVIGFTADHKLTVGKMTAQAALDCGIVDAVSFVTFNGISSTLIADGVPVDNPKGAINPRTAIGQREDGTILMLILDGRCVSSLGATVPQVTELMQRYGAVNAANLDGGASTCMAYDGEFLSICSSVTGARRIPTAFVVVGGDDDE